MGRGGGGRSSGGGGRSYSGPRRARAPAASSKTNNPPAARPASNPPAAASSSVIGSAVGHVASAVVDGWLWGAGSAMAHRAMDAIMGPREFKVEHTTAAATTAQAQGQQGPCDIHAQAFQDCISHNGADISRCQFYVDVLNDCRRRGQVAVVEASG